MFRIEYAEDDRLKPKCYINDSFFMYLGFCFIQIDSTLVWIHSPSLTTEYCGESVLLALPTTVEKLVMADIYKDDGWIKGKVCQSICGKTLMILCVVRKTWFRNHWFDMEYKGWHML